MAPLDFLCVSVVTTPFKKQKPSESEGFCFIETRIYFGVLSGVVLLVPLGLVLLVSVDVPFL
jgi:hypothetical protein